MLGYFLKYQALKICTKAPFFWPNRVLLHFYTIVWLPCQILHTILLETRISRLQSIHRKSGCLRKAWKRLNYWHWRCEPTGASRPPFYASGRQTGTLATLLLVEGRICVSTTLYYFVNKSLNFKHDAMSLNF